MKTVEVKLFGAFRKWVPEGSISVELRDVDTARDLKRTIGRVIREQAPHFLESELVEESALATESQILLDDAFVYSEIGFALLPPVSGG
jgi:molybdopterin converting factor small subunit